MKDEEVEEFRKLFPVTKKHVYFDHAGVSPVSVRVKEAVCSAICEATEEGAFAYSKWNAQVEKVRESCGRLINADRSEIAFIRSTSHGLSIVSGGIDWKSGDNVVIYEGDFPSNIFTWERVKEKNVEIRKIRKRIKEPSIEEFRKRIDKRTKIVTVSSVQFTTGYRADISYLGELCRQNGAHLCVDAIQALGMIEIDVKKMGVDYLAADAHKWILGPEGIGMFYCRSGLAEKMNPVLVGWKSTRTALDFENPQLELRNDALRFEEGSSNLIGIVGLGAAVDLLMEIGVGRIQERVWKLGERLIQEAERRGFEILTPKERNERGGIITFKGSFHTEEMQKKLKERGIMVNTRGGGIRVSPHFYNTEEEIERLFEAMDGLRDDVCQGA